MRTGEEGVLAGLGVLATGDVAVRAGPGVLGVSDQIILPLAVVTSRTVVDAGTVGWAIGWLTLLAVGVFLAPYLFPQSRLDWASGLVPRLVVGGGATALGLLVEATYRSAQAGATSPLPVAPSLVTVGGTLAGSALLLGVTAVAGVGTGATGDAWLLPRPETAYLTLPEEVDRTGPAGIAVRGALVVLTLGVVFATAAQLYPLTEALVVGVAVFTLLAPTGVRAGDPIERLAVGAVAAWGRLRHVTALLYLLATLLILIAVTIDALGVFPVVTLLSGGPVGIALLLSTLVVPVVHVLKYADRAFHSFAVELDRGRDPGGALPLVDPGRAPGFMIHAGALLGLLDLVYVDGRLSGPVPPGVWAAIAALTAITLWASYGRAPYRVAIPDHHAVPLAVALWIAAGVETGAPEDGFTASLLTGEPVGVGAAVDAFTSAALVMIGVLFVYAPVGALAYGDDTAGDPRTGDGDSLETALVLWGLNTVVWTGCLGVLYVMTGTPGSFVAFDVWMARLAEDTTVLGFLLLLAMGLSFLAAAAYTLVPLLSGRLVPRFEPGD